MSGPHITDHAIVRYLERIEGIDIDALRERILPSDSRARLVDTEALGDIKIHTGGHVAHVISGKVVTVTKD